MGVKKKNEKSKNLGKHNNPRTLKVTYEFFMDAAGVLETRRI